MTRWRPWGILKLGADQLSKISAIVREELLMTPAKRKALDAAKAAEAAAKWRASAAAAGPASDSTSVVVKERKVAWWERSWEMLKAKVMNTWMMRHLRKVPQHPIVAKSHEIAEDLRERWETSDSPVVHRIQDLNESLFGETATAMAYAEIRRRDPEFSLTDFVSEVQEDVGPILRAYMQGEYELLREKCSREVVERCDAEKRVLLAQGLTAEEQILHISDLELRETKLLGTNPVIILSFRTQQTRCVKDQKGIVREGGKDNILSVFHLWAMQQATQEEVAEANAALLLGNKPQPKWRLREMQQLGMQALI